MSLLWGQKPADLAEPAAADQTRAWMTDIAQAGYDGFALFDELLLGLAGTRSFARLVEETGLQLASVDYVIDRDFERLRRVCEVMQRLGARHLVTIGGLAQRGADMDEVADLLDAIGEVALEYGVRACYHNHTDHTGQTLEETEALLARTDPSKFFGFLDVGHATKDFAGHPVEKRAALFLQRNWDRIDFLEFKDWSEEWDLRTEVGAGRCDYAAVFDILKRRGSRTDRWVIGPGSNPCAQAAHSFAPVWVCDHAHRQAPAGPDGSAGDGAGTRGRVRENGRDRTR